MPDRAPPPVPDATAASLVWPAEMLGRLGLVVHVLAHGPEEDGSTELLVRQAVSALGAGGAALASVGDDGDLVLLAATGLAAEATGPRPPLAEAVARRQQVWRPDPHRPGAAPGGRPAASAAVPLVVDGEVIGALGVVFDAERAVGEADRTFLAALADTCARWLHRRGRPPAGTSRPALSTTSVEALEHLLGAGLVPVVVCTASAVIDGNGAFWDLLGRGGDEPAPVEWSTITPAEWVWCQRSALGELVLRGRFGLVHQELWHRDGGRIPVRVSGALVSLDPFRWVGLVVADDPTHGPERAELLSGRLLRFNDALARSATTGDVIAALDVLRSDRASTQLWLVRGDRLFAAADLGPELQRVHDLVVDGVRIAVDGIPRHSPLAVATALRNGRPAYFETREALVAAHPVSGPAAVSAGTHAVAFVPLPGPTGIVGVLRWSWGEAHSFDAEAKRFYETIGDAFAVAYQRAVLHDRDRSARRRAEGMLDALAGLASASSRTDVARTVVELGLPTLGASGVAFVAVGADHPDRAEVVEAAGYDEALLGPWRVTELTDATPVADALRGGLPVYLRGPADARERYPDVTAELIASGSAWVALPLRSAGHTIGCLALTFATVQDFDEEQRLDLAAFASHVADALARAGNQEEDHNIAVTLQRSLLADALPSPDVVRLGARYLPGSDLQVGGDWYDAILLDHRQVMLVVGDVIGHGLDAAVAMGQLRSATRALARSHSPAGLLRQLDRFADDIDRAMLATVACVLVELDTGQLTYSLAGHPPPLLRHGRGRIEHLDQAVGVPLAVDRSPRTEASVRAGPGSLLTLYTDGLIERRGESLSDGIDRLARALRGIDPSEPERACDQLIAACLHGYAPRDDIALLCASVPLSPERT